MAESSLLGSCETRMFPGRHSGAERSSEPEIHSVPGMALMQEV